MNSLPHDKHYQVPRRFGLRTALVVTAVFALLLSVAKWTAAPPLVLIVYSSFVLVVGAAQVVFERSPRFGSILAGALFLPVVKLGAILLNYGLEPINTGPFTQLFSEGQVVYSLVFGALYGYLGGTMLAGLYLVADKTQLVFHWRIKQSRLPSEAS